MPNTKAKVFLYTIVALGTIICAGSIYYLPLHKVDFGLVFIAAITILFNSRLSIQMPGSKVHFMMGDALIFLTLLIYGGEAAIILAAAEAFGTSLRLKKQGVFTKFSTILQNTGIMALSTAGTYAVVVGYSRFFQTQPNYQNTAELLTILGLMALTQFSLNTGLVALIGSLKSGVTPWQVWNEKCVGASVTNIVGVAFAGLVYKLIESFNVAAVIVVSVIGGLLYYTYRRYVAELKTKQEQAEEAERERVAAEKQRAATEARRIEEAEQHISQLAGLLAEQERISEALRQSKERFQHAALHDNLTGLANRAQLFERLRALLEINQSDSTKGFSLLFFDLDRFKNVNDSLGHEVGDKLLVVAGQYLQKTIRQDDLVARLGGDEFAIVLNGMTEVGHAFSFAERIRQMFSSPFRIDGQQVFTGISIGIVLSSSDDYQTPEEILRDADMAMYHAKSNKIGCAVFEPELGAAAVKNIKLETDLHYALQRNELRVYYQPILSLETGFVAGFEALIRWQHPERGLIPPMEFIPLAETTGLIAPITLWVLRQACSQLSRWHWMSRENRGLFMSVNLSSKHFTEPSLASDVEKILIETGVQPGCLKLEITESAVMENALAAAEVLEKLRELGVSLAIDDFGTGYSSLSHLHEFPIDTIKVDRSFINRMERAGTNTEIVYTIVTLAKMLKMEVVAEGVETEWQAYELQNLGVKYAQGFLFSRPVPAEELDEFINQKRNFLSGTAADCENRNLVLNGKIPSRTILALGTEKIAVEK
ncbi:MAG: EAL domain-containing protein [Pyrinomonadaceae bacterium]